MKGGGQKKLAEILQHRKERTLAATTSVQQEEKRASILGRVFGAGAKQEKKFDIPKTDIKGHRVRSPSMGTTEISQAKMEQQTYKVDKGPRMMPRKERFKSWFALSVILGWFYFCYALLSYRLRADDLELMEREVYEELAKKKEVERMIREQDLLEKVDRA